MTNNKKRSKIGLALGSGGAKGIAHIGVIKELEKNGIPIDMIAGASIGAMVGGAYCTTKNILSVEEVVKQTNWKQIFRMLDPKIKGGLLGGEKVKVFFSDYAGTPNFKDLKIPFIAVACDLISGETYYFNKGDVVTAVRASTSYPSFFRPVKHKNMELVDGGLSAPVPVDILRENGMDIIIAVNLDHNLVEEKYKKFTLTNVPLRSLNVMRYNLAKKEAARADIIIEPKTGNVYWDKFVNGDHIVKIGENAMKKEIEKIKNLLK